MINCQQRETPSTAGAFLGVHNSAPLTLGSPNFPAHRDCHPGEPGKSMADTSHIRSDTASSFTVLRGNHAAWICINICHPLDGSNPDLGSSLILLYLKSTYSTT